MDDSVTADLDDFVNMISDHRALLYKIAQTYCTNPEDRQDLLQEITIQLWNSWSRYDPRFKMSTWIYRVALNNAISFYRKDKARRSKVLYKPLVLEEEAAPQHEENSMQEKIRSLRNSVQKLPEIDKALITLHLENLSHAEISEIVGISISNVSTRLSRIRKKLKVLMSKQ